MIALSSWSFNSQCISIHCICALYHSCCFWCYICVQMMSHLSSSHVPMWSWTIIVVEHQRIDVFKLWCWRRFLRVPWTSRRSNQSTLKEINSLEGNWEKIIKEISHWSYWCWSLSSNTLATWCKEPSHWKRPWCWEILRAGEERGDKG